MDEYEKRLRDATVDLCAAHAGEPFNAEIKQAQKEWDEALRSTASTSSAEAWTRQRLVAKGLKIFWKLLTLLGTILLFVIQFLTPDIPLYGRIFVGVLTVGWFLMFLFLEPDVG